MVSSKNAFGRTVTLMGESLDIPLQKTINPILPSSREVPISTLDLGLQMPEVAHLPEIYVSSTHEEEGEFKVVSVVGEGGMGVVELVHQQALQRDVVIKRPKEKEATNNQIQALVKEGLLTGQLEHPNIVPVHFLGRLSNGLPALVMKRISGTCWRDLILDSQHPAWEKVQGDRVAWHLRVLLQVCNAVEFAHSQDVIHRDIKPENVMLGDFGEVYLLDWGIGIKLNAETGVVKPNYFAGSPAYMAPEMVDLHLSVQTDVYLLGATLHELLTQTPLHDGDTIEEVLWQAQRSIPKEYGPDIPEELANVCHRATHREPSQRFASVREFRQAIEEHLGHRNAIDLVESAQSRLTELQNLIADDSEEFGSQRRLVLHELATECRFALREALKLWPNSKQAKTLLQQCTELMAGIELKLGNISSAELLLAELDEIPPELSEQLKVLWAEQAEALEAQEKLRSLEHNIDTRVGASRRSVMMVLWALVVVGTASAYTLFTGEIILTSPKGAFLTGLAIIVASAVAAIVYRDVLIQNKSNRQFVVIYFAGCIGILISRGLAFVVPTSLAATFIVDMTLMGFGFFCATVTIESRLIWAALVFLSGVIITLFQPSWAYAMVVITTAGAALCCSLVWLKMEQNKSTPKQA